MVYRKRFSQLTDHSQPEFINFETLELLHFSQVFIYHLHTKLSLYFLDFFINDSLPNTSPKFPLIFTPGLPQKITNIDILRYFLIDINQNILVALTRVKNQFQGHICQAKQLTLYPRHFNICYSDLVIKLPLLDYRLYWLDYLSPQFSPFTLEMFVFYMSIDCRFFSVPFATETTKLFILHLLATILNGIPRHL